MEKIKSSHNYIYIRESPLYLVSDVKYIKLGTTNDLFKSHITYKMGECLIPSFYSRILNIHNYKNEDVEAIFHYEFKKFRSTLEYCSIDFFCFEIKDKIDEVLEKYGIKYSELNATEINNNLDKKYQEKIHKKY